MTLSNYSAILSAMQEQRSGRRGGTTTIYPPTARHRVTIYLYSEEAEALRNRAFHDWESASKIVRRALRKELGLDPPAHS